MTDDNLQAETPAEGAPALPDANADTAAPPTATDEATETPADDAGKEAKPKGVGARIDELTGKWRSTERERDYWRELALKNQQPTTTPEPPKPAEPLKLPTLAEYEYDEAKYQAALVKYAKTVAERKAEQVIADRERAAAQKAREQSFREREAKFKAANPDYEAVAYYAPITSQVVELIRDSEDGPELAYFLGKNPELALTISQLPETVAAREIGKLEARLAYERQAKSAPAAAAPAVSKAPPPPPKVEATEPAIEKDDSQMSDAEWYRHQKRLANLKQNQRKR